MSNSRSLPGGLARRFRERRVGVQSASDGICLLCQAIFRSSRRFFSDMDNSAEARIFEFGGFRLDAAKRQLGGPDGVVELPSRAFDVLLYMVAHPGELLDKARLLNAVWPDTVVEEGRLSQCIFALRRAFGDTATEPRFIATVAGTRLSIRGRGARVGSGDGATGSCTAGFPADGLCGRRRGAAHRAVRRISILARSCTAPDFQCQYDARAGQHCGNAVRRSELVRGHGIFRRRTHRGTQK